jgi:peptidoglycan/xylan/chitin deacetylase (PgdA/CDA1 family)
MYHRIAERDVDPWYLCVTSQNFAAHLEVLQQHAHPIGLAQLAEAHREGRIPNRAVAITFDDGYIDNLERAKPLLERFGIPATVFITGGTSGKNREFWWDELYRALLRPGTLPSSLSLSIDGNSRHWDLGAAVVYSNEDYQRDCAHDREFGDRVKFYYSVWEWLRPLSREQRRAMLDEILAWSGSLPNADPIHRFLDSEGIRTLSRGGLVEIGGHTMTHEMLPAHPVPFQRNEIMENKIYLEELLGYPVASFSYPFGEYAPETVSLVREAGFSCACSVIPDVVWQDSDRFLFPRFAVNDWNGQEFKQRLEKWFRV